MQMSVAIGPYGSYDPVETPTNRSGDLLGPNRSTWSTFFKLDVYTRYTSDTRCVTALQSYTAIQRYNSAMHYTAMHRIHYTTSRNNTPLVCSPRVQRAPPPHTSSSTPCSMACTEAHGARLSSRAREV